LGSKPLADRPTEPPSHPNKIGNNNLSPSTRNHNSGPGVPAGLTRRFTRIAARGSSSNQRV